MRLDHMVSVYELPKELVEMHFKETADLARMLPEYNAYDILNVRDSVMININIIQESLNKEKTHG